MRKTYLIFVIQAYDSKNDLGQLTNPTVIELIDTNYDNAEKRAKQIIDKPFYRLSDVVEKVDDSA